jgi:hypothetical protein
MAGKILISTAYLPPVEYFSLIHNADEVIIEKEENYLKQSYRNRSYILTAHGKQTLTVPVFLGSFHKTPIKDIRIDYSKRWQQVHLRAIITSYRSAPYFEFYFEEIEKIIHQNFEFLIDLNASLTASVMKMAGMNNPIAYSSAFEPVNGNDYDLRYRISPKKEPVHVQKEYTQVFNTTGGFVPSLSIIDLIFNAGPETQNYL